MDTLTPVEAQLPELGPRTWGGIFLLILLASVWISRKLSSFCLRSQRSRLRDEYEHELRVSGQTTNQLLLPLPVRTSWNPR